MRLTGMEDVTWVCSKSLPGQTASFPGMTSGLCRSGRSRAVNPPEYLHLLPHSLEPVGPETSVRLQLIFLAGSVYQIGLTDFKREAAFTSIAATLADR